MKNNICVYDYETDGSNPATCEPVQLAACIIHPITLDIIENSEFCIDMRPINIDDEDYYTSHLDTINWHAKNYGVTPEEIFSRWKGSIPQKDAWNQFTTYLKKYNKNQSNKGKFSAPIRAGANISRFDDIITTRLCERYDGLSKEGEQKIFHPRDTIDIKDLAFYWFENSADVPAYNMDELRNYFGIPTEGGHDALKDVKDEAWIIRKMIGLHRYLSPRVTFKGSYNVRNNSKQEASV